MMHRESGADFEMISSITGQLHRTLRHYACANIESISRAVAVLETFAENSFDILGSDTKTELKLTKAVESAS